jgi:hypothetical protein
MQALVLEPDEIDRVVVDAAAQEREVVTDPVGDPEPRTSQ